MKEKNRELIEAQRAMHREEKQKKQCKRYLKVVLKDVARLLMVVGILFGFWLFIWLDNTPITLEDTEYIVCKPNQIIYRPATSGKNGSRIYIDYDFKTYTLLKADGISSGMADRLRAEDELYIRYIKKFMHNDYRIVELSSDSETYYSLEQYLALQKSTRMGISLLVGVLALALAFPALIILIMDILMIDISPKRKKRNDKKSN